jgi:tetratricopeptide (TPR) repeat protein
MPRALLQMGRTCEALGAPDEALDWYARVIAEYPRLEEAARAKELMAGVRVAQGPEQYPEAERLLMELVNDETIGPQAAVHRDALLAMCDLLYYQGRYGEAIGRLHDFLTLYPNDPERTRGEFAMADAYRRSAYALRADATGGSTESRERFHQAADLYDQLFTVLNPVEHPDEETQLYARLALFDRADCFLELNEPESLREALAIYRTAAARYEAQPAALTAHTQIANICLRLGQVPEAARALARARWILKTIPDEEFAAARSCNRAAWEQFLTLAAESDLLHVELTSACGPPPSSAQEP